MKKLFVLIALSLFFLSSVSAFSLNPFAPQLVVQDSPTSDMPQFIQSDLNPEYGALTVTNTFFWIGTSKVAEYSLTDNTNYCLIDCAASGKAVLYSDGTLFDNFDVKDINGNIASLIDAKITIDQEEQYQVQVPDTYHNVCKLVQGNPVASIPTQTLCYNEVATYRNETRTRIIEVPYNGETLLAGNYSWHITGKKISSQSVDWAVGLRGISTDEVRQNWANWTTANCLAAGGQVYIDGDYCVHVFNASSSFNVTVGNSVNASVLVVAGGGGGAMGGGGAGGLIYNLSYNATGNISVVVGLGGLGSIDDVNYNGGNGTNSSFGSLQALLGAGGGRNGGNGNNGGSGGGGGSTGAGTRNGGTGFAGQGNNGGSTGGFAGAPYPSGGGGGCGAVGQDAQAGNTAGNGGTGCTYSINGTSICYAGGGGGGTYSGGGTAGTASCGGTAGQSGSIAGANAVNGTGGGGGGVGSGVIAGNGGTGIVIVRYLAGTPATSIPMAFNVTLLSPTNGLVSNIALQKFNATLAPTGENNSNSTLYIWFSNSTVFTTIFNSTSGVGSILQNWTISLPNGNLLWNVYGCGYNSSASVNNCSWATSNYTISIDTVAPTINITYPTAFVPYQIYGNNISINYTFTNTTNSICIVRYNGIAYYESRCGINQSVNIIDYTIRSANVTINNSFNVVGSNVSTWEYYVFDWNSPLPPISGGAPSTFIENISSTNLKNISSVNFIFNNTAYVASVTNNTAAQNYTLISTVNIPVSASTSNFPIYWNIIFTDGIVVNTTQQSVGVPLSAFSYCNSTTNTTAINFTILEEATFIPLNGSIQTSFAFFNSNATSVSTLNYSFGNLADNQSSYVFCVSPSNAYFNVSGVLIYSKAGYDGRTYIFSESQVSNNTQNVALYLLATAISNPFTFTVLDQSGQTVTNAQINVQRWDIATNTFPTSVEIVTDSSGQATTNLRTNDATAWYRYQVLYNGQLYLTTIPYTETTTSRTLTINLKQQNPYSQLDSVDGQVTYNNATGTFVYTFADPSGSVGNECLQVTQSNASSSMIIINSCLTTASGTIIATLPAGINSTFVAQGVAQLTSSFNNASLVVGQNSTVVGTTPSAIVSRFGQLISTIFMITGAAIGAAANSILLGLGLIVAILMFCNYMGWVGLSIYVTITGIISIGILIALIAYRRGYG
jgi:hypothetical protein